MLLNVASEARSTRSRCNKFSVFSLLVQYKLGRQFKNTSSQVFSCVTVTCCIQSRRPTMSRKNFRLIIFLLVATSIGSAVFGEHYANDEFNGTNDINEKSFTWLKGAQDMIASPAGHVVVQVAKELLNRSTGNSQVRSEVVLSLNLTNLLIILLLKVLIFAAGILGAGHLHSGYGYGYNYARSIEGNANENENALSFGLSNGEDSLITAYLAAQGSGVDGCLYAAACANPKIAQKYAKAARALMEGIKKFDSTILRNPRYNDLITLMEKATYDGSKGIPCQAKTNCDSLL